MNLDGKKTYIGIASIVVGELLRAIGVDPIAAAGVDAEGVTHAIFIIVGVALAIYGRFQAKRAA